MELRSGRHLVPGPSDRKRSPLTLLKRVHHRKPQSFRLLDLPTELRLMIYGYAFGHENVHWTMTYECEPIAGYILALGHVEGSNNIRHNISSHQRRPSLLRTCRQVSQEASPIYHNQTRFDIGFCRADVFRNDSAYRLRLTHGRGTTSSGVARVVLQRVQHIHFHFRDGYIIWSMHILGIFFGHGSWLKSLRFTKDGDMSPTDIITWDSDYNISDFASYRGDAVLVLRNANLTKEDFAELEQALSRRKSSFSISVFTESNVPRDKKDCWSEDTR